MIRRSNGSFVDDKKVSDHHAIIPTEQFVQLDHMTNEERKIYDMVVRRFLSVLYPAFEYEQTAMEAEAFGYVFAASGKTVKNYEERKIYDMVVRRFLSVLYPAFEYEQTAMEAEAFGYVFAASGKTVKNFGWKDVYEGDYREEEDENEQEMKDQSLPVYKEGEKLKILDIRLKEGKTKPPARRDLRKQPFLLLWKIL